jgi:Domain of unknown function (DUF4189)
MPEGDASKGFKWSLFVNNPNAAADAMKNCRESHYPRSAAACKLIESFSEQCAAVAVSGDPAPAPVVAGGWGIAPDSVTATKRAIARCEVMRKGRGKACVLDAGRSLLCDGQAK